MVKKLCDAAQINHQAMYNSLKAILKMYEDNPEKLDNLIRLDFQYEGFDTLSTCKSITKISNF